METNRSDSIYSNPSYWSDSLASALGSGQDLEITIPRKRRDWNGPENTNLEGKYDNAGDKCTHDHEIAEYLTTDHLRTVENSANIDLRLAPGQSAVGSCSATW